MSIIIFFDTEETVDQENLSLPTKEPNQMARVPVLLYVQSTGHT